MVIDFAAELHEVAAVRHEVRGDEDCVAANQADAGDHDSAQPVVLDVQPCDLPVHDADSTGDELLAFVGRQRVAVREVHDVLGPLAHKLHLMEGGGRAAKHPHLSAPDLPAVAVRAVQHVSTEACVHARDVGQLVAQARGDEQPPGRHAGTAGQHDLDRGSSPRDPLDPVAAHDAAVLLDLRAADRQ